MKTPIFGPFYISRSSNLASDRLVNLYGEIVETKQGKSVGALYSCPGLVLKATVGNGPIQGLHLFGGNLLVVSGGVLYQVTPLFAVSRIGAVGGGAAPVSIIDNRTQYAIFNVGSGYLGPPAYPLTGAQISDGGGQYAVNDQVVLSPSGGAQIAPATITVTAVNSDTTGVTDFVVTESGAFSNGPASFSQASTTGNGSGLTLDAPTFGAAQLTPINLPFTPNGTISAAYQDGFGLINQPNSNLFFQSDLLDLSTWNALNFGEASGDSDNIVALAMLQRTIWVIKQFETEIWYDAGTANFAFAIIDGAYIEAGIGAQQSLARSGENLFWLAQSSTGDRFVVMSAGQEAKRVSTFGLEDVFRQYSTVSDAIGYCYQQDGHEFYVLNFPTADATWVYDKTVSLLTGIPMWHERASFSNGLLHRHIANNHCLFAGLNIVGDSKSGNLYAFDLGSYTDNGAAIKKLRAWRALPQATPNPTRFSQLAVDMEQGITVPADLTPVMTLRWSDDGAHTWSNERYAAMGKTGKTAARLNYNRLGSTRRNSGLDRIFELSTTDPIRVAIIGADLT